MHVIIQLIHVNNPDRQQKSQKNGESNENIKKNNNAVNRHNINPPFFAELQ
jgi:hypothetical protein